MFLCATVELLQIRRKNTIKMVEFERTLVEVRLLLRPFELIHGTTYLYSVACIVDTAAANEGRERERV